MNSIVTESSVFDKIVFEAVTETLPGGMTLDLGSYTGVNGMIPAGLPVTAKDGTTGLGAIVTHSSGTLSATPIGYTKTAVPINLTGNNVVAVVLEGIIRLPAMATGYSNNSTAVTNLKAALPRITHLAV